MNWLWRKDLIGFIFLIRRCKPKEVRVSIDEKQVQQLIDRISFPVYTKFLFTSLWSNKQTIN